MDNFDSVPFHEPALRKSHIVKINAENLLYKLHDNLPDSREKSLAITKLEECVMWANKAIAKEQLDKEITDLQ